MKSSLARQGSRDTLKLTIEVKGARADTDQDPQSPRPKGNLDTDTLALIREIGSALLMSPSSASPPGGILGLDGHSNTEPEACSNMVKYFVRKIEQQQQPPVSSVSLTEPQVPGCMDGKSPHDGDDSTKETKDGLGLFQRNTELECLSKTRSSSSQQSLKTGPAYSMSGDPDDPNVTPERNIAASSASEQSIERLKAVGLPESASPCTKSGQTHQDGNLCVGQAQDMVAEQSPREEELPSVFESPAQTPGEDNSPTVKHLVGKFESGQAADMPSSQAEQSKGVSHHSAQSKDGLLQSVLNPPVKETSSSSSETISSTFTSPGNSQQIPGFTPSGPAQASNCNMPDCDIPVELYELPSSSPGHTQQQKRMATSPHHSPPSAARSVGPRPFSQQSMAELSGECRSWRPVRPKSASDQPRDHSTPMHHQRSCNADFSQHCMPEGASEKSGDTEVTIRQGSGEEGRKKRRLHGKSLPLPSTYRMGGEQQHQQQQQQQQQQQKPKLGQGPFYSSM